MTPNPEVPATPVDYEPPAVTIIGSLADLTQGYATPGTEGYDDGSQE